MRYIQYYVGTAAPKLIPQLPQKKKSSLPKERKQKSYTIPVDPLALGGIVVSAVMLILMVAGFVRLGSAQRELAQLTSYVNTLQEENAKLEDTYEAGYDLEMVESAALGLGMIPIEEAERITISLDEPVQQDLSLWARIGIFLEGLFA